MAKTYRGNGIVLRRKTWWLDCVIQGVRYQRKLGKGISATAAHELSLKYRVEILSGNVGYGRKIKDLAFADARTKFEAWATANKKPGTAHSYKECLRRLAESFAGKRLSQISSFALEKHKQARIKEGARVRANRELAVLKCLYNRMKEWKLFDGENPVDAVKLTKEPPRRLRFLERAEEDRLLAVAKEPLRTLIQVGIYTGLRLHSEALTLRWTDIDLGRRTVTVQAAYAKNGKTRSVPLHSTVVNALTRLPRRGEFVFAKPSGKVYISLHGFITACRTAGLPDVTPHVLRHTFATRLCENGVDLRLVQELGGWASLALVQRYAHVAPSRKIEAIEGLSRNPRDIHSAEEYTNQLNTAMA